MKIDLKKRISFFEVDSDLMLRPKAMLNYLQEAAAVHSEKAGYETQTLMDKGYAWVLHRINIHIHRRPTVKDALIVRTWHAGEKGFRAYRDFEILCGNEKLVSANSLWLFIDLNHKKILRVPKDTGDCYTVEASQPLDMNIDSWNPVQDFDPEVVQAIATRPSDYDPLGHVNNAIYFDYLEMMMARFFAESPKIRHIIIQFIKEIPMNVSEVMAGILKQGDRYVFKLFSNECVHAAGEFQVFSEQLI